MKNSFFSVIIPAAGSGSRMNSRTNKQFLELAGKPIIIHTLLVFDDIEYVNEIIIVAKENEIKTFSDLIKKYNLTTKINFVVGGETRQESVHNGILSIDEKTDYIVVHDGARPFIKQEQLKTMFGQLERENAVIMAVPTKDTIKRVDYNKTVIATLNRKELWNVQTPQMFERKLIEKAYNHALKENFVGTDDSSLVEFMGGKVSVVMGSYNNIKITTAEDLIFGEIILKM